MIRRNLLIGAVLAAGLPLAGASGAVFAAESGAPTSDASKPIATAVHAVIGAHPVSALVHRSGGRANEPGEDARGRANEPGEHARWSCQRAGRGSARGRANEPGEDTRGRANEPGEDNHRRGDDRNHDRGDDRGGNRGHDRGGNRGHDRGDDSGHDN